MIMIGLQLRNKVDTYLLTYLLGDNAIISSLKVDFNECWLIRILMKQWCNDNDDKDPVLMITDNRYIRGISGEENTWSVSWGRAK